MKRFIISIILCVFSLMISSCKETTVDTAPETSETAIESSTETSATTSSEETTIATTTTTSATAETTPTTTVNVAQHQAYKKALMKLLKKRIWPGTKRKEEFFGEKMSENQFAIVDIDLDGVDELIVNWNIYMGMTYISEVFEYDVKTNKWKSEGNFHPFGTVFYDNGVVLVPDAHNMGWGVTIYPYSISIYNPKKDKYKAEVGHASCWDKSIFDAMKDSEGMPKWPAKYDKDNVGVVYFIDYKGYDSKKKYSQSDYDKFLKKLVGDANVIPVKFKALTKKNINKIASVD